jgi:hypothetical protein
LQRPRGIPRRAATAAVVVVPGLKGWTKGDTSPFRPALEMTTTTTTTTTTT